MYSHRRGDPTRVQARRPVRLLSLVRGISRLPAARDALASRRVIFRNTDVPTGVLLPDGRATVLSTDRQTNIDRMERISPGDGKRYGESLAHFAETTPLVFGMLGGEPWRWNIVKLFAKVAVSQGPQRLAAFFGDAVGSCR